MLALPPLLSLPSFPDAPPSPTRTQDARQSGFPELRIIVGKGNHSPSHVAKIKPAVEDLMARERLTARLDPQNAGVLVVLLQGQGGKGSREIMGDLERDEGNDCVIM